MKIYVSAHYFTAWRYIPILLLAAVFQGIAAFAGSLLGAIKKPRTLMWSTLTAAVANAVLSIILIPCLGLWGAAIGTLISNIIVATHRLINVKKHLKIDYRLRHHIPVVIITVLHIIFVSLDMQITIVSGATILVYSCLIHKDIKLLYQSAWKKLNSYCRG